MRKLTFITLALLAISSICFAFWTGHAPPYAIANPLYSEEENHCWVVLIERIDNDAINLGHEDQDGHKPDQWSEYQLLKCRILKRLVVTQNKEVKFTEPIGHDEEKNQRLMGFGPANPYPYQFLYLLRPAPGAEQHMRATRSNYKAGRTYICTAKETTVTGLYTPYADCENMIPYSPDAEKKFVAGVVAEMKKRNEE